jgi:hypothetical protein
LVKGDGAIHLSGVHPDIERAGIVGVSVFGGDDDFFGDDGHIVFSVLIMGVSGSVWFGPQRQRKHRNGRSSMLQAFARPA